MGRTLAATVVIGEVAYLAGSVPPDDVAAQITNPAAWGEDEAKQAEEPTPAPAPLADEYIGAEDETPAPKSERPRPSRRSQS